MASAKGRIEVDHVRCKGCELCIIACPHDVLALSDTFSANGYYPAEMVKPEKCTGCKLCAIACPDVAIEVWKFEREKK
ncbi:MAG: 4Fe-4S dicluster domain-containing protein [candidate division Zixibacteria bacterium]|nr:4Fe-4S dicluster domain-containing protein [candidate division Zixibacteria bacterium]